MFNIFVFGHARPLCLLSSWLQCISSTTQLVSVLDVSLGVGMDIHFLFSHYIHLFSPSGELR